LKTPLPGLSWGPLSSNRGCSHLKSRSRDLLQVPCHQIGAAAFEIPIARTFLGSSVIKSRQRPSKKHHCQDVLGIPCHEIGAAALDNPIAGTFWRSHVFLLGRWPSKTPFAVPSWGPASSNQGSIHRIPHCLHILGVLCHQIRSSALKNPIPGIFLGSILSDQCSGLRKPHCQDLLGVPLSCNWYMW